MSSFLSKSFYLIFSLLMLISIFFMEGGYSYYLFFSWSLFFLIYSDSQKKSKNKIPLKLMVIQTQEFIFNKNKKITISSILFFASLLFLLVALVNIFFSHHLAFSLDKILFYIISISTFLFFLRIDKKRVNLNLLIEYLLLITVVLNTFVIILSFYSGYNYLFQGMNLLVRTYGHNHYVAFLLLILPLIWWTILKKVSNHFLNNRIAMFFNIYLLISSYFLIVISLSRLALFISIFQFFMIFLLTKKNFYDIRKNKIINFLLKSIIFVFLFTASLFIILSLSFSNKSQDCPLNFYKKNLCLSISENSRIFYWRQAWLTFKKYPLYGYGLGTFKLAARLFPVINERHSAFAHNIFLHNLAEMGILGGGSFIFLISLIFYQSYKKMKKNYSSKDLEKFLFIAALSSLTNAMFDFDWHFFVIFTLTLIFLALIINNTHLKNEKNILINWAWQKMIVILIIFGSLLVLADLFINRNFLNKQKYFKSYMPLFNIAVKDYLKESSNTMSNHEYFHKWYRYDTEFIYSFLRVENLSLKRKQELYLDLAAIDPAGFINTIDFKEFSECCLDDVELLVKKWIQIAYKENLLNDHYFFVSYDKKINLANQFFDFAQQAYGQEQWYQASYFYKISHYLNPYIFSDYRALFLDDSDVDNLISFFQEFKGFPADELVDTYAYLYQYRQATDKLFQNNLFSEFEEMIFSILDQEPEFVGYFIGHLYETTNDSDKINKLSLIENKYTN